MTVKEILLRARDILQQSNAGDAALAADLLLCSVIGKDRVFLLTEPQFNIDAGREQIFWELIERYAKGEPLAYITGHREFFGLDFQVDSRVLIPRPETELLVEKAIALAENAGTKVIADIGTGCGCIAVSLAKNLPAARIYATDASCESLELALCNCHLHGVMGRVLLLSGNLLEPLPEPADIIVANLPYVRSCDISGNLCAEPRLALDGGADGLAAFKSFIAQLPCKLNPGGKIVLEIGLGQAEPLQELLRNRFPQSRIEVIPDLSGIERMLVISLNR